MADSNFGPMGTGKTLLAQALISNGDSEFYPMIWPSMNSTFIILLKRLMKDLFTLEEMDKLDILEGNVQGNIEEIGELEKSILINKRSIAFMVAANVTLRLFKQRRSVLGAVRHYKRSRKLKKFFERL